jgi:hypothetical protein
MFRRILNILIPLDALLFGILCLGNVQVGETASEAAYRMDKQGKFFGFFRHVIDWLALTFFNQEEHCRLAYEAARERARQLLQNSI